MPFDRGPSFELEPELVKEINCRRQIFDDDSYVVHPFDRHVSNDWSPTTVRIAG